jgi:hypothetical protein
VSEHGEERQPAGSGSDGSADTRSAPDADSDAAQPSGEAPERSRSRDPLDAVEREAGGQLPAAAAASGGQPVGQPSQWAALTVQRDGSNRAAASGSDGHGQPESDSDSESAGSTGWARSAAPPSTTATGRSRRRRQEVGPQDVQRLVASKRQVRHVSSHQTFLHAMLDRTCNTVSSPL